MACIKAETGTLTFAIINMIVTLISTVGSLGVLIWWVVLCVWVGTASEEEHRKYGESSGFVLMGAGIIGLIFTIVWLAFSLLNLVFASLLLNGSLKKKPEHIKAYFIYGVIVALLSSIIILIFWICDDTVEPTAITTAVLIHALYCVILYMVNYTYRKMGAIKDQYSHKQLVEKF